MDAAVSMSQVSLPTSSGSDMYFKVVYEDPERPKAEGTQSTAGPGGAFSSSVDKLIDEQEKNLIKQLESTSLSQSQRLPKFRTINFKYCQEQSSPAK